MIEVGKVNNLHVDRKSDIGYILTNIQNEEVVLFFNDATKTIEIGDNVDAFIFLDAYQRKCATLQIPYLKLDEEGILKVVSIKEGLGVFLDNGIRKHLLLSYEDLPLNKDILPQINDEVLVVLKLKNNLIAKPVIRPRNLPLNDLKINDEVEAVVTKVAQEGILAVSYDFHYIFIYKTYIRSSYRVGQVIKVKIINAKEDSTYNGSLIEQKENQLFVDSNMILSYLLKNDGVLNLDSESSSEEVFNIFKISRKSFKRALGHLYKERRITFNNNKTILVSKELINKEVL
ncbi:MAG: hypothetical protein LBV51_05095 [Acholeplasmatales bacterium]|jgi:predicted RNA-binding protein (virulence factor B family)|nr:hypothetical protein [Acholeplasmatales bacterium]